VVGEREREREREMERGGRLMTLEGVQMEGKRVGVGSIRLAIRLRSSSMGERAGVGVSVITHMRRRKEAQGRK
jgi:hypothetical protein